MKCPFCHVDNDRVIDTRASEDGIATRRRRECLACKRRYTTYERIEGTTVKIVKKDGSREPFDRAKIKRGLEKACWKRPISDAQLEINCFRRGKRNRNQLTRPRSKALRLAKSSCGGSAALDQVAYVRFASVYRQFKDARDFVDELRPMLAENRKRLE